ncbi:hypothetical protein RCH09_000201 [Actimicrobium sp. GrIS 1.19]|nr:hypothetical protein [Actimicrobium sp. GrIS 1.19]
MDVLRKLIEVRQRQNFLSAERRNQVKKSAVDVVAQRSFREA